MPLEWSSVLESLSNRYFSNSIDKFCQVPDQMKVLECYNKLDIRKELLQWILDFQKVHPETTKSLLESTRYRGYGNEKFKFFNYEASLKLYTKSVIFAPRYSVELSLALGNRSAVLFRMQQFENCIRDVDLAISNFKVIDLYPKLMIRKGRALCMLQKLEDGLACLNEVKQYIMKNETFPTGRKNEIIDSYERQFYETYRSVDGRMKIKVDVAPPTVLKGENKSFPYASNLLELKICSEDGKNDRRVLARETVETGDILFVENPFSFVLLPDYYENYCQFCCKSLTAPLACWYCVNCLYCSEKCRDEAYHLFHKWECKSVNFLQNLGVGHLVLRTTIIAAQNRSPVHCQQVSDLVTHLGDVPGDDLLQYTVTATLLYTYLDKFATDHNTPNPWKREVVSFMLLRHIIQIICNGFAIKKSGADVSKSVSIDMPDLSHITVATGLYPSAAMMNHSCDPNIITSFFDNLLVVRASKRIEKGNEVFNCYGPHFRNLRTEERKAVLKSQFFFNCKCDYCLFKNNPIVSELILYVCVKCKQRLSLSDCQDSRVKCRSCCQCLDIQHYEDLLQKTQKLREKGVDAMISDNFERASDLLKKCKHLQQSFLDKSDVEVLNNLLDLAKCYCGLGDYMNCWKSLKECIPIIRERRGEYSIEYADIIRKTVDMVLRDIRSETSSVIDTDCITDLFGYVDDMVKAVELNFGTWSPEYSSLRTLKSELVGLVPSGSD